jgi:hypothetical protein
MTKVFELCKGSVEVHEFAGFESLQGTAQSSIEGQQALNDTF